jgi:hypothetical protein
MSFDDGEVSVEFEPDEVDEVPALKKLEIDTNLCCSVIISKDEDDRYFATWQEDHPELGDWEEYFSSPHRTPVRVKKWAKFVRALPSKHFRKEISLRDAYEIIAWFFLPEELHAEAGL